MMKIFASLFTFLILALIDHASPLRQSGMKKLFPSRTQTQLLRKATPLLMSPTPNSPLRATLDDFEIDEIRKDLIPVDLDLRSMGLMVASQGLLGVGAYALCTMFDINPFTGPTPISLDASSISIALQFTLPMIGNRLNQ